MLKSFLRRLITIALVVAFLFGFVPSIHIDKDGSLSVDMGESPLDRVAKAATVTSGRGTWISDKLTYSYSVATASNNTQNAAGSVSVSNRTMTVKATNSEKYTTGSGCDAITTSASETTTTVTVTNISDNPLKVSP